MERREVGEEGSVDRWGGVGSRRGGRRGGGRRGVLVRLRGLGEGRVREQRRVRDWRGGDRRIRGGALGGRARYVFGGPSAGERS